ncbi:MAG: Kiwa anti-phage protein KwaB-like domain-containing protein [Candidatus Saccharimonas sp.]
MIEDQTDEKTEATVPAEPTDIFLWANQADAHKDALEVDLFLFTKGYTVYATNYAKELKSQLKVLFLYDMISQVQTGAATGMMVRDFEATMAEDNVLERTTVDKVDHVQEVVEQILYGEAALEVFHEGEHEFKKVKGIIARFSREGKEPFFVAKILPQSQVLRGATAWMYNGDSFQPFSADAGLRVTPDNQVLITGNDIFAFSESKFIRMFGYDAKKLAVADEKIKEIEKLFRLKFPDGMTFEALARDTPSLAGKLQKVDPTLVTQDQVVDQADEMDLELMTDDATGEIIIMDAKDATKFINLLNDNYMSSDMTGIKYELKGKKELRTSSSDSASEGTFS